MRLVLDETFLKTIIKCMNDAPRTVLAQTDGARVELCACGTIHLKLGPVTVRVPAAALRDLSRMLADADARIGAMVMPTRHLPRGLAS